jgi:UDP-glucose 4-epimerase
MSETLLITGVAGFIASHLADAALAAGHRVIALDNLFTGKRSNIPEDATFLRRDIRDSDLGKIMRSEGVTAISHHAAQVNVRVSVEQPVLDASVNVIGTLELIRACQEAGVRKFLFASSGGTVYGEQEVYPCDESHPTRPMSPYGCSKLSAEEYLRAYQRMGVLDPVVLRYANIYGARQDAKGEAGIVAILAEKLLAGISPTIFGDGEQTRDYVHVSDVAAIQTRMLEEWVPGVYNVGTSVETSVNQLFYLVSERLGTSIPAEYGPAKAGELARNSLDASRLEQAIGIRPRVSVSEGLELTLPYYLEQASKR